MNTHIKLANMKELGDSVSSAAKLKKDTDNFKEENKVIAIFRHIFYMNSR